MNEIDLPLFLGEFLLKSGLVIVLGLFLVATLRFLTPGAKHLLWLSVFVAVPGLPFLLLMPRWEILPRWEEPRLPVPGMTTDSLTPSQPFIPLHMPLEKSPEPIETGSRPIVENTEPILGPDASSAIVPSPGQWLGGLWFLGAIALALRPVIASLLLRRIRKSGSEPPGAIMTAFERVIRKSGMKRRVTLLMSPMVQQPYTWGVIHPRIILPESASQWRARELEMILLHETAHVQRYDALAVWVSRVFVALNWVNPLAWLALRQTTGYREQDCDSRVLQAGHAAAEYAEMLLRHVRQASSPRLSPLATGMAETGTIEKRIRRILGPDASKPNKAAASRIISGLITAAVCGIGIIGWSKAVEETEDPVEDISHAVRQDEVPRAQPAGSKKPASAKAAPGLVEAARQGDL
ncbi:MAG: M56 family metallopeptidase, partial [Verrucomicrobiota bacterium]